MSQEDVRLVREARERERIAAELIDRAVMDYSVREDYAEEIWWALHTAQSQDERNAVLELYHPAIEAYVQGYINRYGVTHHE